MVIILPDDKDGLEEVEAKLSSFSVAEESANLYLTDVEVTLPKFRLEETVKVTDLLLEMGINELFSKEFANFTGITEKKELFLSKFVQKAFIALDEDGVEAAAATAKAAAEYTSVITSRRPQIYEVFKADHPFIVNILYKNILLFMGSVKKFSSVNFVKKCISC